VGHTREGGKEASMAEGKINWGEAPGLPD
jgi:hypothetical protein